MNKQIYSVDFLSVFQLKNLCKDLGIKGYSGKKKLYLQNKIRSHLKNKQETEVENTKGLYFYPAIIQTIFEYHIVDDINLKRIEIIENSKTECDNVQKLVDLINKTPRVKRKYLCRSYMYHDVNHVLRKNHIHKTLSRNDFIKFSKQDLQLWLKTLYYKPKGGISKLSKKNAYALVISCNEDLSLRF
jgi:hypothetical protein